MAADFTDKNVISYKDPYATKDPLVDNVTAVAYIENFIHPYTFAFASIKGGRIYYRTKGPFYSWNSSGSLPAGNEIYALYGDCRGRYIGSNQGVFFGSNMDDPPYNTWVNVEGDIKSYAVKTINSIYPEGLSNRSIVYVGTDGHGLWYSSSSLGQPVFSRVSGITDQEAENLTVTSIATSTGSGIFVSTRGNGVLYNLYHNYRY